MKPSALRTAVAFAVLLAAAVGVRLLVVWRDSGSGAGRLLGALVILAVFVGIPAAYGLRGLLRGDGDDDRRV